MLDYNNCRIILFG